MGQHPGYYTRQIAKLEKELKVKQSQYQIQQDVNDGLRWKERMLKGAIAAMGTGVKAVRPAPGQQSSDCASGPPATQTMAAATTSSRWQSRQTHQPAVPQLNSNSYCLQDMADADASAADSSTVDAALESAIFSALDEDSSTDLFFPDLKTKALNHLLSRLATTELKVQSSLLRIGCSDLPGDGMYTSQLLQQLLATEGQTGLHAAAEASPEECLLQLAAAVKQISCLLPRYDDGDDSSCQVTGWSARSQLDCLIDQQVQSAVARSIAGKPCAALQHLAVNMETMRQQAYPDGWFARVAAALQLTAGQKAVFRAAWGKAAADRASLLAKHELLAQQLQPLQQQQAAVQQEFGARVQKASERCVLSMQKQARQSMQALQGPATGAAAAAAVAVGAQAPAYQGTSGAFSFGSLHNNTSTPAAAAAAAATVYRSSTPPGGCSSTCSGSSSSSASTASAAAVAALYSNTAVLAGVTRTGLLLQQQQQQLGGIRPSSATALTNADMVLSMTCNVEGPTATAAAAAGNNPFSLACDPQVLLCELRPGQLQLQQKLAAVRASLGVLHAWCGLVCYNTLSRKQLAVAAVTSYPFAFDPLAVCEAAAVPAIRRPVTPAAAAAAQ
uniref:Uncharacterized protein n=1 Tax=Tetradesmus obliquus TaxID=3088 RepID=A0A383W9K1_TETOB|eukprot:jgi/Sobl393_1/13050/SZX74318.1